MNAYRIISENDSIDCVINAFERGLGSEALARHHGAIDNLDALLPFGEFDSVPLLSIACAKGDERAVLALLRYGSDPNCRDLHDQTPLHWAARSGQDIGGRLVDSLVSFGANVNAVDDAGVTPVMSACSSASDRALRSLLRHRCDLSVVDRSGFTVLDHALTFGSTEVILLLVRSKEAAQCLKLLDPESYSRSISNRATALIERVEKSLCKDAVSVFGTPDPTSSSRSRCFNSARRRHEDSSFCQ